MADWFGSVQATDEEAEILRKQVLEAFGGSEHSKRSDHSRNSPKSQNKKPGGEGWGRMGIARGLAITQSNRRGLR